MFGFFYVKEFIIKYLFGMIFVFLRESRAMKNLFYAVLVIFCFQRCNTTYNTSSDSNSEKNVQEQDTVRIANDDVEYEIIIIEPGFNSWLAGRAKPEGYYTQEYLENKNRQFVVAWNNRVLDPARYDPILYEQQIDYNHFIDYGYEVNYKLYNYFIYFQIHYKQQLTNFVPRI